MNALDKAITKGKELPIRGRKKLPSDSDVIISGIPNKPKAKKKKKK